MVPHASRTMNDEAAERQEAVLCFIGVVFCLVRELFSSSANIASGESFNWVRLWLGLYLNNAVLPCCMFYTYINPWVEWGGIRYCKSKGKVCRLLPCDSTY